MDDIKYSAKEFAAQARELFQTTPDAVIVALRMAQKKEATLEEAKQIVNDYLNMEVL